ncbi:cytochrome c551 [Sediminibacillus halophilus]|uniref:Cytochrome c551 n=1 Tax=Sediminibacillus halophilus TaxID=482461 RepID=A0A1G9RAP6_9BACI|nr:cytochrome c [Sediminibacillus halophilus]SDM20294.1 cytochrome c551 [Sediminibacillus halophilus]
MKKILFLFLLAAAFILNGCGSGDQTEDDGQSTSENQQTEENSGDTNGTIDTAAAEEEYEKSCQSCHGADLSGNVGPDLREIGSKYSQDEILEIIEKGRGGMPPGQATGEDAELISAWLAEKK